MAPYHRRWGPPYNRQCLANGPYSNAMTRAAVILGRV